MNDTLRYHTIYNIKNIVDMRFYSIYFYIIFRLRCSQTHTQSMHKLERHDMLTVGCAEHHWFINKQKNRIIRYGKWKCHFIRNPNPHFFFCVVVYYPHTMYIGGAYNYMFRHERSSQFIISFWWYVTTRTSVSILCTRDVMAIHGILLACRCELVLYMFSGRCMTWYHAYRLHRTTRPPPPPVNVRR
jgi:hypothetical protein